MTDSASSTRRGEFLAGARATFPLIVGAVPFGIIFGALAVTSGLSPVGTVAMSAIVFAGSSQFIAAGLLAGGASTLVIIVTTFVVNVRHALYATSLAPHMRHLPQRWLLPLGFWMTDETYLVAIARYYRPDLSPYKHWYYFGSALFMYTSWQASTLIGLVAGGAIPDPASWGLDFAMYVTFTGMLVPMITNSPMLASVAVGALVALLANSLPNQLGLIVAAIAGVAAGVLVESLRPARRSRRPLAEGDGG